MVIVSIFEILTSLVNALKTILQILRTQYQAEQASPTFSDNETGYKIEQLC